MHFAKYFTLLVAITLVAIACQHTPLKREPADVSAVVPPFKKVVLVIFENEDFDKPLARPFFKQLAENGALLTNYHGVAHPSEPNYIALTSGDTQKILDDESYDLKIKHLGDLLEAKHKTWKNYAENFPGHCFLGAKSGRYVRKHTPFISYTNVSSNSQRCENIVNASQFIQDVKNNRLPDFAFYTPNMDDDAHDTNISYADDWFKTTFAPLLKLDGFKDVLLVITFDENECNTIGPYVTKEKIAQCQGDPNQIYTVLYGLGVKTGMKSNAHYDHYSLLKTLELGFDLETLGQHDSTATPISGVWGSK